MQAGAVTTSGSIVAGWKRQPPAIAQPERPIVRGQGSTAFETQRPWRL